MLDLPSLPKTMIIVGGGVIGVEYTCMFSALGVRVTLIERRPRLLEFADQEIVEALSYHLRDSRVHDAPERRSGERGRDAGRYGRRQPRKQEEATGRRAAVRSRDGRGMSTNSTLPKSVSNLTRAAASRSIRIFAPKSRTSLPAGTSLASRRSRRSRWSRDASPPPAPLATRTVLSNPSFYPYGIYTIPEISFIGKTEEQLTEEDVPYEVGVAYYREIARGQIRGDTTGRLKLIFHRVTHTILGVHIIGEGASELLHIGQAVMALGGKLDYFVETVFNYPTLAECYKVAAFNGLNRVSKFD